MNDVDFPVSDVLLGIDAAIAQGLGPIKVNMVVKRGVNDHEVVPMARYFKERHGPRIALRFIEFMDVGSTNGWRMDEVVPSCEIQARLEAAFGLEPLEAQTSGETAQRFAYRDGSGEVGLISSVTAPFCRDCNRARLSTEGKLFLCLFAHQGHDLRALIRGGRSDMEIATAVQHIWQSRADRYSELRGLNLAPGKIQSTPSSRVEMHYIGG
jgi:cyclic pyranopterin phosphate synthase